jgi:myosin-5
VLLDLDAVPDFMQPNQRPIKAIETFIPTWISLPFIQAVLSASLSAKQ